MSFRWPAVLRRAQSALLAATLVLAVIVVIQGGSILRAAPARAAGAFLCTTGVVYSLDGTGHTIYAVTSASGSETSAGSFAGAAGSLNGLALTVDGLRAYSVQAAPPVSGGKFGSPRVYEYNAATGQTQSFAGPSMSASGNSANSIVMGGINPANNIYYFGIVIGSQVDVYGFDTTTDTAITNPGGDNRIAELSIGTDSNGKSRGNGDLVFDDKGRVVFVASSGSGASDANALEIINQPFPSTAAGTALTPKAIAYLSPTKSAFNGITFDGDGSLYVEYANGASYAVSQLNPDTGATIGASPRALSQSGSTAPGVDLASCTYNNALTVQKNIANRYAVGDQFTVDVELHNGGTLVGNSGTTTGSDTGVQGDPAEIAGPLIGMSPTVYDISERAAGTADLSHYTSVYSCVDTLDSTWSLSGVGTSFSLAYPTPETVLGRDILCTFTNATLETRKSIVTVNGAPATSASVIRSGDVVGYRIAVTNPGNVSATTTLTETVPANSTFDGGQGWACTGTAAGSTCTQDVTVADSAHPGSVDFTVTVGVLPAAATTLDNLVATSFGACVACTVDNPVTGSYTVSKTATSPTPTVPGSTVTYTVTIQGVGPAVAGASVADDLSDVLDDAQLSGSVSASTGAASVNGRALNWSGDIAAGQAVTITYSVTVDSPDHGNGTLVNAVTPGPGGSCVSPAACATTTPVVGSYTVAKSVQAPSPTRPGDTVGYTLTVIGAGAPVRGATVSDDLAGVLDDAAYNGDAAATAGTVSYAAHVLSWTGDLAAGQQVEITYSVTVGDPDTGDGSLVNVATPGLGGDCARAGACTTTTPVAGSFTVHKSANPPSGQSVQPGGVVQYTLTITGVGAPVLDASLRDDLSAVLDDATYNGDARATAGALAYSAPGLSWTGDLAAGQVVTATYSVTVDDPDTGDAVLTNSVTPGAGGTCDQSCSTQHGVPGGFTVTKDVDPASGTEVAVGQRLTYTLTVTGGSALTNSASFSDDLTDVVDDASVAAATADAGTVTRSGDHLDWTIPTLAAGQVVTITYTATVDAVDHGNATVANTVRPGAGGLCAASCSVANPVRGEFAVVKKASVASAKPGGTVSYTVTVTAGPAPVHGAGFVDSLADVLDDATISGAPSATYGAVAYNAVNQDVTWSGDLTAGQVVTVVYAVVVNTPDVGDGSLVNTVTPGPAGNCPSDADCTTTTPVTGSFTVSKSVNPASGSSVHPGQSVRYTLTVTAGDAPVNDASLTDDLSQVLDDAAYDNDVSSSAGTGGVSGSTVTWTAPTLTAGQIVTITYSVTVDDPDLGDGILTNVVAAGPDGECLPSSCSTTNPVPGVFTVAKTANVPSGSSVKSGDRVTYTITVTGGDVRVDDAAFTDDLSGVLAAATYNGDLVSDAGAASYHDGVISWSIPRLAAGQLVQVVYSVTTKAASATTQLTNAVVPNANGHCVTFDDCTVVVDLEPDPVAPVLLPPASGLAYTGTPLTRLLGAAFLLVAIGAVLSIAARRRRRIT